jgi:hypothetical protein
VRHYFEYRWNKGAAIFMIILVETERLCYCLLVKVSIRIHNMNTDRLICVWVLHRRPVNVFSVWVPDPGTTTRNLKKRIDTPIVQRSELQLSLGEGIYAVCPG